jgi:thioesterase domain-containing protein
MLRKSELLPCSRNLAYPLVVHVEEDDIVVEIRGGSQPPLWLLHPIGGNVLYAHSFAKTLPTTHAVRAVQARGLNGKSAPFTSIVDAARFYLSIVTKRQPRGPYFLAGPSFGGILAYEMACMLQRHGHAVGLLALMDAFGPNYPRRGSLREQILRGIARGRKHLAASLSRSAAGRDTGVPGRLSDPGHSALYELARIPSGTSESVKTLQRVSLAHEHALHTYHPSCFDGRIELVRAERQPTWQGFSFDDPANGWNGVARGGVRVTTIPGTHQFILDPPWVDHLALALGKLLAEAGGSFPEHDAGVARQATSHAPSVGGGSAATLISTSPPATDRDP